MFWELRSQEIHDMISSQLGHVSQSESWMTCRPVVRWATAGRSFQWHFTNKSESAVLCLLDVLHIKSHKFCDAEHMHACVDLYIPVWLLLIGFLFRLS